MYPAPNPARWPRRRIALLFAVVLLAVCSVAAFAYAVRKIHRADAADASRDRWQKPEAVLANLDLQKGDTVVDLGCGGGYFALKLSATVGREGRVLGVDTQWPPLLLLKSRAVLRGLPNVGIIRAGERDPRLPAGAVNAVLIVNAYHEMEDRDATLAHVRAALVAGGRLVIVDQKPSPEHESHINPAEHHEMPMALAESEVRRAGFNLLSSDERFTLNPAGEVWWLMVASKP
jgi:predicted methyltransferase